MKRLANLIPTTRWVPHDIEQDPGSQSSTKKSRDTSRIARDQFQSQSQSQLTSSKVKQFLSRPTRPSKPSYGPFLRRRTSTLSFTGDANDEILSRTHAQGQSLFFAALPAELRRMVYELVVGQETLHLVFAKRKFGHFVCDGSGEEQGNEDECGCKILVGGAKGARVAGRCLGMMAVSRRMYIEAIPYLYSSHTFSLLHITHLLYLPTALPTPRLNNIRTLHLKWTIRGMPYFRRRAHAQQPAYPEDTAVWERGWGILSSMEGLRDLRVVIVDPSRTELWRETWLGVEDQLTVAVRGVDEVENCVVVLPYEICGSGWEEMCGRVVFVRPGDAE